VGFATAQEVDKWGPLKASHMAMQRALAQIDLPIEAILVDGNKIPELGYPTFAIVKGDDKNQAIGAASILAKVSRTHEMDELSKEYPNYQFNKHQGYGTAAHAKAIDEFGVLPMHRMSYKPIKLALKKQNGIFKK
jgi:ribonuclease HII